MRTNKPKAISDVLRQFVKDNHMEKELSERDLVDRFMSMLSPALARSVNKAELRGGKLFVSLDGSAARHELFYQKDRILEELKEIFKNPEIKEIVLI